MRHGTGGFSLVEALIATAVLSIGMGGMSALMLSASGGMSEAEHSTIAHLGADVMAATLQLSPVALEHFANPPHAVPLCFEDESCTTEDWALSSYTQWRAHMARQLPSGAGLVCRDATPSDGDAAEPACDGAGPVVIKVFWREPRRSHGQDGGARRAVVQVPR